MTLIALLVSLAVVLIVLGATAFLFWPLPRPTAPVEPARPPRVTIGGATWESDGWCDWHRVE